MSVFQTQVTTTSNGNGQLFEKPEYRDQKMLDCIWSVLNLHFSLDTIFINYVAASSLSKMPDANGEEYTVDSSQLQVNVPSAAVVMLL